MISPQKHGPWALIAGGSEGIGAAFAQKLAATGLNLVLIARKQAELETFADEVRKSARVQVRTLALDLTKTDVLGAIRKVTDDVEIGLLIFNAAAAPMKPFFKQSEDELLIALRISGVTQTLVVQHFAAKMADRKRGGIILMGSLAGNAGVANIATYCGAKAYTQMFGEALYSELKPLGIDVLVYTVGAVDTPNRRRSGAADVPGMPVLTPDAAAQDALDQLGVGGPFQVPPSLKPLYEQVSVPDRRKVADMMSGAVPLPKGK